VACSAAEVAAVLLGDNANHLGESFLSNAVQAVLHFFKSDLDRTIVTVDEFSAALVKVLRGFGLNAYDEKEKPARPLRIAEADLRGLASDSGRGFELLFFSRLRDELRAQLVGSPQVIRFNGLRSCVKQLTGSRRWTRRCQTLNDQIVDYLRTCLGSESNPPNCALLVR
jgi:hypothetical protein